MSNTFTMLAWLLGFLAIAGIAMYGILIYMQKHELVIRDLTKHKKLVKNYWVLEKKDKQTGVIFWQTPFIMGKKIRTPEPPPEAVDITPRGKKHAECYRLTEDQFIWITDKDMKITYNNKGEVELGETDDKGKYRKLDSFRPFTVVDRDTIVSQHIKAAEKSAKGQWTADKVIMMTGIGGIVVLAVCVMIFFGDIVKPLADSQSMNLEFQRKNMEMENRLFIMAQTMDLKVSDLKMTTQTPSSTSSNTIVQEGTESAPKT